MAQLDFFSYFNAPAATPVKPAVPTSTSKPYTITRDPLAGYRVVLAPGITSKTSQNPCMTCPRSSRLRSRETCSAECIRAKERADYLLSIGASLISAVSSEGAYEFGS